jgi:hypothetical protein
VWPLRRPDDGPDRDPLEARTRLSVRLAPVRLCGRQGAERVRALGGLPAGPLEAALLKKFHAAMTPPMVETLTRIVNTHVEAATQHQTTRVDQLKAEILQLEPEVGRLVRFLAQGGESETVRDELRTREAILRTLRLELSKLAALDRETPPRVHPTWLLARLERLDHLLRHDPVRAKAELAKHLDGELTLTPLPSVERNRRAEIRGRAKLDGLLEGQEALLQYVGCGGLDMQNATRRRRRTDRPHSAMIHSHQCRPSLSGVRSHQAAR